MNSIPGRMQSQQQLRRPASSQLAAAYAACRNIARSAASNFYCAFLLLPSAKRDALCAVYAFMRHADDICDNPGFPVEEKREKLNAWRDSLHQAAEGFPTDDPVLLALADTQLHYQIPIKLLDLLVEGTAMDLPPRNANDAPVIVYRNFEELYRYCYYVASVVGLVSIRVFGYRDAAAELLAERCGVGFQLTNIIRDVKEDAGMGRIYLPQEDLASSGISADELANALKAGRIRPVLELQAKRAREFYASADELLALIDKDSRAALWALVSIYRRLLEKIAKRDYDVFSERVRLTAPEKLSILAKGLLRRLTA